MADLKKTVEILIKETDGLEDTLEYAQVTADEEGFTVEEVKAEIINQYKEKENK